MSKPAALSPYLSLREAVRPAIFAYSLLAAERERAGELAAECEDLLRVTRELLKQAALVHLLSPEPGQQLPDGDDGDRQARLLEAYADAGMLWVKAVGSCMAIGGLLLEQQEWDTVRHLAAVLESAGETESAKALSSSAENTLIEYWKRRTANIHRNMSAEEIGEALAVLRQHPRDFPMLDNYISVAIGSIVLSICRAFPLGSPMSQAINAYGVDAYGGVDVALARISAEFQSLYRGKDAG